MHPLITVMSDIEAERINLCKPNLKHFIED